METPQTEASMVGVGILAPDPIKTKIIQLYSVMLAKLDPELDKAVDAKDEGKSLKILDYKHQVNIKITELEILLSKIESEFPAGQES